VTSTARAELRLLCPWPSIAVQRAGRDDWEPLVPDGRGIVAVSAEPGERLRFQAR